jgi:tRNA-splicing ligase RtcB
MTPDYPAILARLDSLDEHVAKRLAGRLLRLRSAAEPGFLETVSSIVANPAASLPETWAELEPLRAEVLALRNRQRLLTPRAAPIDYRIYGAEAIHESARKQMEDVMRLEPVVAGALMPDAHVGYGMPIGGVAAVENAVIPYAVGVDIGCRMHLTVFREPTTELERLRTKLRESILKGTHFGRALRPRPLDHPLLDDPRLAAAEKHLQKQDLRTRAALQFGTSGGGNHFVEFGELRLHEAAEGIPAGNWIALLSHSGSRALGFNIANHFSGLAKRLTSLPKELERLAWLPMDTEEGRDYWDAMEIAGEYSAANHQVIHDTVVALAGLTPVRAVSNHHNFAWKEVHAGKELLVHRKGATPAGAGVLGIIPGSMGAPGFLVRGRGAPDSLASASHGAGRQMSRTQAMSEITAAQRDAHLSAAKVELLGGGLDEAPGAYKDIRAVIGAQADLVEILAEFHPRIVRMAGAVETDPEEGN